MITTIRAIRGSENALQFTGEHHWSPITLISSRCFTLLVAGIRFSIGATLWVWDWVRRARLHELEWSCGWSGNRSLENTSMRLYWTGGNEEKVQTLFVNNGLDDVMYVVVNRLMYSNAFINDGALPIKVHLLRCQRLDGISDRLRTSVSWCWWIWLSNNVMSSRLFMWTSRTLVTGWIYTLMSQLLRRIILTHTKSRICSVGLSETMTGWMGWTMMD